MSRRAALLLTLPLALVGCGNSRTQVPSFSTPAQPAGFRMLRYPDAGIALDAPTNWSLSNQRPPLVIVVASGTAVVAVWRFPRPSAPPGATAELERARRELIRAVRARDSTLQLIKSKIVAVDHARAIELDAIERVGGQTRRVRSTHVFVRGAELVLDEYAPTGVFHAVDHAVFSPVKRSLRLAAAFR